MRIKKTKITQGTKKKKGKLGYYGIKGMKILPTEIFLLWHLLGCLIIYSHKIKIQDLKYSLNKIL